MALKIKKTDFTKAFTKTKLGFHLDKEINKGDFEWEFKVKPKEEDDAWHPSSHCMQTPLELYHIARGELEAFSGPKPYKTFQVGHFWHAYLQEICMRANLCESRAIEVRGTKGWGDPVDETFTDYKPYHWVTGSADIAPCEIPGHGPYIIDFKTMGGFSFKPNRPPESTLKKWECQLNIYMDFFDLEKALIVGINKDSPHDFKEFEFHRNQSLIDALYYKWKLVAACLEDNISPPADEVINLPCKGPTNV